MIIIVSSKKDEHAQAVLAQLEKENAKAFLLDFSLFPQQMFLSMNYMETMDNHHLITEDKKNISLSSCKAVWWRRPQSFELHPEIINPAHRHFAINECNEAFRGLWLGLDATWINHPTRNDDAASKPYQLNLAQRVGLEIPATLITNNVEEAHEFINRFGHDKTVYKAFSATEYDWRETRLIKLEELELLDNVRFTPVIFQEYIPAGVDLRITMVGETVFAASIHSQETSYKVDFRMDMSSAKVEPFNLPSDVTKKLKKLMTQLGLVYGAIDMRLTPDGRFVFLEINPAGQWLFIEERTKQPITQTLAQLLNDYDH